MNRTILVQATVENSELLLRPGMFVNADISTGEGAKIVAVPKSAIDFSLYGDSVYVVNTTTNAEGKSVRRVERRSVTLGEQAGDRVAVLKGVNAGDEVITAGQIKLQNNQQVMVDNAIALRPDASQTKR